ncbi:ABC transporter permease [Dictyobacter sp. S3.2.2.5]|uniref:ABC transporter permease n=1 Tax=Dictyobacter halimunensis TaxID=3026934 RepID=A0ABQ6FP57_9CHLR|nr:ABC transporter permease [Dictyobacter sp. S3.2.2.5]
MGEIVLSLAAMWGDISGLIAQVFHYHFMHNAYLAGTLVALSAGVIGYFMVLRGQSFAGHSLANVGFAGATGAALLGIPAIVGLFVAGVLAALGIQVLHPTAHAGHKSDVAIGAVFTAALALGFLFVFLSTSEYASNIYNVLFGNILGIGDSDVQVVIWSTLALFIVLFWIARPLFFLSLDPTVAAAQGVPVRLISLGYLVLLALVVAIAVQVVGALLIFALLVTPAAIAQTLTSRPGVAVLLSALLAIVFTWIGLAIGFFTPYPVSFCITSCAFGTYLLASGGKLIWRKRTYKRDQVRLSSQMKGAGNA